MNFDVTFVASENYVAVFSAAIFAHADCETHGRLAGRFAILQVGWLQLGIAGDGDRLPGAAVRKEASALQDLESRSSWAPEEGRSVKL